ncbi:hypothetical protein Ancab_019085 [Ancistrocladus abbreviatus]
METHRLRDPDNNKTSQLRVAQNKGMNAAQMKSKPTKQASRSVNENPQSLCLMTCFVDLRYYLLPVAKAIMQAQFQKLLTRVVGNDGRDLFSLNFLLRFVPLLLFLFISVQLPVPPITTIAEQLLPTWCFRLRFQCCHFSLLVTLTLIFSLFCSSSLLWCSYPFIVLISLRSDHHPHPDSLLNFVVWVVHSLQSVLSMVPTLIISIAASVSPSPSLALQTPGEMQEEVIQNNQLSAAERIV